MAGDPYPCTFDYDQTDSKFQEVCTSDAVQGQVVVSNFEVYCNSVNYTTYYQTSLRAPLCVANGCEISKECPGKPSSVKYAQCVNKNSRDELKKYHDALTITTKAIASSMNKSGIEGCYANNMWSSGGTTTSHNGIILVMVISSAVFVAMTTLLF